MGQGQGSMESGDGRSCEGGQGARRSPAGGARSSEGGAGSRGARLVKQMQLTSSAELESS